ncbi:hypothetical protein MRX96_003960 [Rhipicephalus microplus]
MRRVASSVAFSSLTIEESASGSRREVYTIRHAPAAEAYAGSTQRRPSDDWSALNGIQEPDTDNLMRRRRGSSTEQSDGG